jgi:hypothetical protein
VDFQLHLAGILPFGGFPIENGEAGKVGVLVHQAMLAFQSGQPLINIIHIGTNLRIHVKLLGIKIPGFVGIKFQEFRYHIGHHIHFPLQKTTFHKVQAIDEA